MLRYSLCTKGAGCAALLIALSVPRAASADAPRAPRATNETVEVEVVAEQEDVMLFRYQPRDGYEVSDKLCDAPCTVQVASTDTFELGGKGWNHSDRFGVKKLGPRVVVEADMTSNAYGSVGVFTLFPGLLFTAVGSLVYVAGTTDENEERSPGPAIVGGVAVGIGAAAILTGIVLLAINSSSEAKVRRAGAKPTSWRF